MAIFSCCFMSASDGCDFCRGTAVLKPPPPLPPPDFAVTATPPLFVDILALEKAPLPLAPDKPEGSGSAAAAEAVATDDDDDDDDDEDTGSGGSAPSSAAASAAC